MAILLLDDSLLLELAIPVALFTGQVVETTHQWYDIRMCAVEPGSTRVGGGFSVGAPHGLEALLDADTILVPGSAHVHVDPPAEVVRALLGAHARGARIVALSSGVFALAAAGLLAGRRATTHWVLADELKRRYPEVTVSPDVLYVEDGNVITSAGGAAGLDLCIELVRLDYGAAAANSLASAIVAPLYRSGEQSQVVPGAAARSRDRLSDLLDWASARLDQPLTLADMSQFAHMTPRTLARRFHSALGTSPLQWLLRQRVAYARQLLETTNHSAEEIAQLTGLGSPSNFRHQFTKMVGMSPRAYRRSIAPPILPPRYAHAL